MRNGIVRAVVLLVGFLALGLVLGLSAERLGDWTDAHPDQMILAWSLWNVGLLVTAVGLLMGWRSYRRARKEAESLPR